MSGKPLLLYLIKTGISDKTDYNYITVVDIKQSITDDLRERTKVKDGKL